MSSGRFSNAEDEKGYKCPDNTNLKEKFSKFNIKHVFSDLQDYEGKSDDDEGNDDDYSDVDDGLDQDPYDYEENYAGYQKSNQHHAVTAGIAHKYAQNANNKVSSFQPSDKLFEKYINRNKCRKVRSFNSSCSTEEL